MKFSYNWLSDYVDGLSIEPKQLERLITMKTAECEGIEPAGLQLSEASVAVVQSVEPIGESHNRKVVVATELYGGKTVVCGAPNCREGIITAYLPLDAKMIEGVKSEGMLASGSELGVNGDHEGIIDLTEYAAGGLGHPLDRCAPDMVIEIDNKSITHRPDLWGHFGMAREVAAITGRPMRDPVNLELVPRSPGSIGVEIADFDLCPRYTALVFENVTVKPSPPWLQFRLHALGLNPINNIVDFTNFVMTELGQPTHAFDRDKLRGDTIFIRPALEGERIVALNDEEYELSPKNLVIADSGGATAIAGVIGGLESKITESTTRIVFESACFNASSVRRTSSQLKLRTDASMRFEKSQDPENTVRAAARAIELLQELSPGIRLVGGISDSRRPAAPAPVIDLPLEWLNRKLGKTVPAAEVRRILESLEFLVSEPETGTLRVNVPSWRATKDVSVKDDLVEEVGRMIGYDAITPQAPLIPSAPPQPNETRAYHRNVRALLAAQGFTEVYNYSFVNDEQIAVFGWQAADHLAVTNPIASDQGLLRRSLLPGIRRNVLSNARNFAEFRLFEIGREIHPRTSQLPEEIHHLVAAHYTKSGDGGLFELKHAAESLMPGCRVRNATARSFEHSGRASEVWWQEKLVGRLFELHPAVVEEAGRASILDLDLDLVQSIRPATSPYKPLKKFPSSGFDLSVVAPKATSAGEIGELLATHAGGLLEQIDFLRVFDLEGGVKSVSYRLTVGAPDRTLASEEVNAVREQTIAAMRAAGFDFRG